MGRNPLILTITSLLLCASGIISAPVVQAEEMETTWWSVSEMLTLKKELDAETDAICHGDSECERDFYFERLDSGDERYWALDAFSMSSFLISSINPSQNTISLFFQAEDPMLKRMGINETRNLTEAYLFWLDDGMIGPAKDTVDIYNYSETVKNHVFVPGVHALLAKNVAQDGANWLPADTEVEFSLPDGNLAANQEGIIYFSVDVGGSITGLKDYSNCLKSSDYEEGMECRAMFSNHGSIAYMPASPDNLVLMDVENIQATIDSIESQPEDTGYGQENYIGNLSIEVPKAPNTGAKIIESKTENNFEWWLVTLIILSSLPIIWLFWPDFKKTSKKSKKSLDKPIITR